MTQTYLLTDDTRIAFSGVQVGNMDSRFSEPDLVARARQQLYAAQSVPPDNVINMMPKGTNTVVLLSGQHEMPSEVIADSVISTIPNSALTLFPADCIPLAIIDPNTSLFALVHLGWKQLQATVLQETIEHLTAQSLTLPEGFICYIGPCIRPETYVFDELTAEQLASPLWQQCIERLSDGYHIDLPAYTKLMLAEAGIQHVTDSGVDTGTGDDYFSNYRHNKNPDTWAPGRNGFLVYRSS